MGRIRVGDKELTIDDQIISAGESAIKAALSVDFRDVENLQIQVLEYEPGKVCLLPRGCGKWKRLADFPPRRKQKRDGRGTYCHTCAARMQQKIRNQEKEMIARHCEAQERRRRRISNYPWQRSGAH
jgi:hypothetical protein